MNKFTATKNDSGRTLIKFITKMFNDVPKSRIERVFRQKDIKVNSKRIKDKKYIIQEGDIIEVYGLFTEKKTTERIKADITFKVIYEDEHLLVVDKKAGVVVHDHKNSLDNQVLSYLKWVPTDSFRPSHVGRLDKLTSGIMLYAKTYDALKQLNSTAGQHIKVYEFKSDLNQDMITEFKITHDEDMRREKCGEIGKSTKTKFWIEGNKKYARLFTGRKHQIRATLSKLNKPIYGDVKYGGKRAERLYLHATYVQLNGLEGDLKYLNKMEFNSRAFVR